MSMQVLCCPYCKHQSGTVAVNDNVKMSLAHRTCPKCRKTFAWYGDYGKLKVMKE